MSRQQDLDRPAAVLALALGAWGGAVALGAAHGVFARISPGAAAALAVLAAAFAPAAIALDASLRGYLAGLAARTLGLALAAAGVAAMALAGASLRTHGAAPESAFAMPLVLLTYFVGPVGLGIAAALAARLRRSAPGKSPAARPAAPRAARTSAPGAGAAGA